MASTKQTTKDSRITLVVEPGKQEILMSRVFDAPPGLVYATYTDPKLIPQWWGPARLQTDVIEMDVRPGGKWRIVQKDTDGSVHGFRGVYHSTSVDGVVYTFEYEGEPGHVSMDTITFEDLGNGQTLLKAVSVFQSVADRDAMVQAGMESGARETWERLATLVAKQKA